MDQIPDTTSSTASLSPRRTGASATGSGRGATASGFFAAAALLACACLLTALAPSSLGAQQEAAADTARLDRPLRVFLDCPRFICDFDFVREQIPYVNWVRERNVADVQVLGTQEGTGAGGEQITLDFLGRDRFAGEERALHYAAGPTETDAETRNGVVRILKLGLTPWVAETPAGERLEIGYAPGEEEEAQGQEVLGEDDPWNLWVFETSIGGSLSGEESEDSYSIDGGLSANRTTEAWKLDFGTRFDYNENNFVLSEGDTVTTVRRSSSADALVVRSLSDHWSVGGRAGVSSSTFRNQNLAITAGPALEYNVYPYDESNRRMLTFLYTVTANHFDYREMTIFEETSETLMRQSLTASLDLEQPWGESGVSLTAANYFHDVERNRLTLGGNLEIQLTRGLEFDVFGSVSRVRDQLHLPAGDASEEDILTRRRELATDYEFRLGFGVSYTFGSIYSNVVNPRFDNLNGGRGGRRDFF
jgi:hypothetical protein